MPLPFLIGMLSDALGENMTKIVGIGGSLRTNSYSMQALFLAAKRVESLGAEVEVLDLRQMELPFCDGGGDYPSIPMWRCCKIP